MTELEQKKIAFADAIIEEAAFNNIDIDLLNDTIEHELGIVWIGNKVSIQSTEVIGFDEEQ